MARPENSRRSTAPSVSCHSMLDTVSTYEDWKDFFTKNLLDAGRFSLSQTFSKGDADVEIYSTLKGNPNTTIEVGYFSSMTLIYIHVLNPETPGKNRQQEIEHLYKHEFDTGKQYGPPGLDFNEINVRGIRNYLEQGFNGSETVYYRNHKLIKSKLTTSYYPDSPKSTVTYYFQREPIFKRLLDRISGRKNEHDEVKTVDLRNIFSGLNDS
jgi:hypothetical protein